jgi:hypothetical protein
MPFHQTIIAIIVLFYSLQNHKIVVKNPFDRIYFISDISVVSYKI